MVMDDLSNFECYDHLLLEPMAHLGWQAEMVSWTASIDWGQYDAVIIRAPWDYQQNPDAFMRTLESIETAGVSLFNPVDVVRWNLCKTYLRDLNDKGVPILPTLWEAHIDREKIEAAIEMLGNGRVVIKPWVSANADHTYVVSKENIDAQWPQIAQSFATRSAMIQPFVDNICCEGEYSLFFFGGTLSHAILKTPAEGDFRVQEEHGGQIRPIAAPDSLCHLSTHVLSTIPPLLYARLDWVRWADGWALMEAELIEPSLYFNMDPEAPSRFAHVFDQWMSERQS